MLVKGMIAGFVGTAVMSAMMVLKSMMGIVPELDPVAMLAGMFGGPMALGWVMHFVIGTVAWGGGYALLYKILPSDSSVIKGITFALAAWMVMMIVVMPMAGKGSFGMEIGIIAPIMTMMLHVIFGAVMGLTFSKQISKTMPA
ncbi:hypothetical protein GCM10009069_29490 [Algimonas arctica]|uniref:DUF1440 domain-containing protein n=1 Tax=Algimonas arctica TaxID=1479486 RepID=A0A8J3CV95_9PROT|nr:DUF6789 family protein [Algimonas arctica]GHB05048.1 hypothetical protein GCM10009069_29490 [Algimonas arctica]